MFKVCPRCQSDWKVNDSEYGHDKEECSNFACQAVWMKILNLFAVWSPVLEGTICWNYKEEYCSIPGDSARLPMLPYDVSDERIKLLITFS